MGKSASDHSIQEGSDAGRYEGPYGNALEIKNAEQRTQDYGYDHVGCFGQKADAAGTKEGGGDAGQ